MLTTVYKIVDLRDKDGNKKENKYTFKRWMIKGAIVSGRACLINIYEEEKILLTSNVEEIRIFENEINLITQNSIYHLKPFVQGV